MSHWQYLSLGELEQIEFSPKVNLEVSSCLNVFVTCHVTKNEMKEIGELVANLLCLNKQFGISERG